MPIWETSPSNCDPCLRGREIRSFLKNSKSSCLRRIFLSLPSRSLHQVQHYDFNELYGNNLPSERKVIYLKVKKEDCHPHTDS